jgi:hypothetical protein
MAEELKKISPDDAASIGTTIQTDSEIEINIGIRHIHRLFSF